MATKTKPTFDPKTLNEESLRAKREEFSTEVRRLTTLFETNGNQWENDAQRQAFHQAGANYDAAHGELVRRHEATKVAARAMAVGGTDAPSDVVIYRPGDPVGERNVPNGPAQGMELRFANGQTQRALLPHERFAARQDSCGFGGDEPVSIGNCIAALVTGRHERMNATERRTMLGGADTGGGYLVHGGVADRVIDLARSASVSLAAGAQTFTMDEGTVKIVKLTADPTAMWRAEGVDVLASQPTFGAITLTAKTLACAVPLSLELMQDAPNAAQIAETALSAAIGLKLDQAILQGVGSEQEPLGILNTSNVNEIASVGTPADYSKFSEAVGKILTANRPSADGLAWVQHPDVFGVLDRLQDTTNQPLNKPGWVRGLRPFSTTSLSTANGIIGDFSQILVGVRRNIGIRVVDAGTITDTNSETHNMLAQMKRLLFAYLRVDVACVRPPFFTKLTGITTA